MATNQPLMNFTGEAKTEDTTSLLPDAQEEDETKPSRKALCAQIVCGVLALAVVSGIVVVLVLFGSGASRANLFGFDDLFAGYSPVFPTLRWYSGSPVWRSSFNGTDCLLFWNVTTNTTNTLFCSNVTLDVNYSISDQFSLSHDWSLLMLPMHTQQIWRHSFRANYLIVEITSRKYYWLAGASDPNKPAIQNALWNPTTNQISFVLDNNICLSDSNFLCEKITTDGSSTLLNGIASWVYEEEVLSSAFTLWWSPKGDYLAFFKTDESSVGVFNIPFYDGVGLGYTDNLGIRYPKAGTPNPKVKVCVHILTLNHTIELNYTVQEYVTDVMWKNSTILTLKTEDRAQQTEMMFMYDLSLANASVSSFSFTTKFITQTAFNGWIEPRPGITKFKDDLMVMIVNNTGYFHLAVFNCSSGSILSFLTSGSWDVSNIVGFNPSSNIVYFLSSEAGPTLSHLYSITLDGNQKTRIPNQQDNGYYTASINPLGTLLVLTYNGPEIPTTTLMQISGASSSALIVLEDNKALATKLSAFDLPKKKFIQITIPTNNNNDGNSGQNSTITLNAWLLMPPRLRTQDFPVLLNVYGGPGSQTVTRSWSLGFNEYLASTLNIAVASVDPRGTGARGLNFMQQTYLKLGLIESRDISLAALTIAQNQDNLDASRLGIWGWSYGGYMTLMCLVNVNPSPFKVGVSVAPVTDWHLYDTFYTERFMSTPSLNNEGYNKTSLISLVNRSTLADNKLLLIHGTGDDNVHFQNSMELNKVLTSSGIQYDTMVYANQNHGISTNGARRHLYKKISSYLEKSL